jgi:NAD(P)-dependent dehydrogenase (short-subunit alcohol dehydrogenase family)
MAKVWLVTGARVGFGRAIVTAALDRGDQVAATARRIEDVADLSERYGERVLPLALDVADRAAAAPALAAARERFGRLDVVVNNAARGLMAAVEEASEADVRDVFETNLFGAIWVTQAAVALFREQGGGHLVQISSGAGVLSWPTNGVYQATKWALEGLSEAVAQEAGHLGVKVTLVQAGYMETNFAASLRQEGPKLEAYARFRQRPPGPPPKGADPAELMPKLMRIVDAPDPPLRVVLGRPVADIRAGYEARIKLWEEWADEP